MSSYESAYESYLKLKKEFAENNKSAIDIVNNCGKHNPQNILMMKTVYDKLVDEAKGARLIKLDPGSEESTLYFTEPLVNKLMHFAFLMGSKAIDEKSFQSGWDSCREDVLTRLDIEEKDCNDCVYR